MAADAPCFTLVRSKPNAPGVEPLPLSVTAGGRTINLADPRPDGVWPRDARCPGVATNPAISPDGRWLAFVAQTHHRIAGSFDTSGFFVVVTSWPDLRDASPIARIDRPHGITWTPDSRSLTVGGEVGGRLGIWSIEIEGSRPKLVAPGWLSAPDWSPDGRRLLATLVSEDPERTDEVVVVTP
jgi:dipeptidyl aminopeptidase/acylaminoacyl peptidase